MDHDELEFSSSEAVFAVFRSLSTSIKYWGGKSDGSPIVKVAISKDVQNKLITSLFEYGHNFTSAYAWVDKYTKVGWA
jgi:hypothetical protein